MEYYYVPIELVGNSDGFCWKPSHCERQLLKAKKRKEAFSEAVSLYEENKANNFLFSQQNFLYCEGEGMLNSKAVKQQLQNEYPQEINILELRGIKFLVGKLKTRKVKVLSPPKLIYTF
jgi:hypothetical protein